MALTISCFGCFPDKLFTPKDADAVWKKIDKTMDDLDSYVSEGTIEAVLYNQGLRFDVSGELYSVHTTLDKKPYAYTKSNTTLRCDEYSYKERREHLEAYYNAATVSNIHKVKDGEYKLHIAKCNIPTVESMYTANSGTFHSASQVILVRFKNGKLVRMESTIDANGSIGNVWTILKMHSVVEYKDVGEEVV